MLFGFANDPDEKGTRHESRSTQRCLQTTCHQGAGRESFSITGVTADPAAILLRLPDKLPGVIHR